VPAFQLVERSGGTVRAADLKGRPWVADFIYTRCEGTCPVLSTAMARLQAKLPAGVPLVSFSVDPAHDTPAVLSGYATRFAAAPGSWLFLTGDVEAMRKLVSEGFHLAMVGGADDSPITHSDKIVLVDEQLRIRRYYDGTEDGWIESLLHDLERLPG
jgi:protein SCO1/2